MSFGAYWWLFSELMGNQLRWFQLWVASCVCLVGRLMGCARVVVPFVGLEVAGRRDDMGLEPPVSGRATASPPLSAI